MRYFLIVSIIIESLVITGDVFAQETIKEIELTEEAVTETEENSTDRQLIVYYF